MQLRSKEAVRENPLHAARPRQAAKHAAADKLFTTTMDPSALKNGAGQMLSVDRASKDTCEGAISCKRVGVPVGEGAIKDFDGVVVGEVVQNEDNDGRGEGDGDAE